RLSKSILKSHHVKLPKYNLPLRIRPWFVVFTFVVMLILGFLGFTNFHERLLINDKALRFLCFALTTGVFYWIVDVEEDARRIWFWRYASLILTGFFCFFCGGIVSEIVQSFLPFKEFEFFDIVANLCGASLGLFVTFHLEKYYRHRREIARIYRPMNTDYSDGDDDEELSSAFLLPTHSPGTRTPKTAKGKTVRFADPNTWEEREEVFNIGDDDDDSD
ncbi:hypothetical protein FA13DRAFT_1575407, partial [Coprinellus micaceus]